MRVGRSATRRLSGENACMQKDINYLRRCALHSAKDVKDRPFWSPRCER
jgi:hypothetical protein